MTAGTRPYDRDGAASPLLADPDGAGDVVSAAPSRVGPRLLLAVLVALLVGAALVLRLGLAGGAPIGAADNGDGPRLYCLAGLVPDTTDGFATAHGVVVTEYRTGGPPCGPSSSLSSAGLALQSTVAVATALDGTPPAPDGSTRFSLEWLGAAYTALLAAGAGVAAFAATAGRRLRRSLPVLLTVIVPPLAPLLLVPWWSRFLVSTFGEPAGLVGTVCTAWGMLALAVSRPVDRFARVAALGLVALGGVTAATAKPGFLPVGLAAVVACLLVTVGVRRRWRRVPGLVAAALAVAVAIAPVLSALQAQTAAYDKANAHNLAFTAVLTEAGPSATGPLGLRPEAFREAGHDIFLDGGRSVPDWDATVGSRPGELRSAALHYVAEHPPVLARMVHRGLTATLEPRVRYLAAQAAGPRTVDGVEVPLTRAPEGSPYTGVMFSYLDALPGRWVPPTVVTLALLAGALTLLPTRRVAASALGRAATPTAVGLLRVAALLAGTGVGVVLVAVLGDGYCELAKHVWLGSYTLVVAGLVLAAGAGAAVHAAARGRT
ncbi:glycan biosynthesis hexose transferase WsfD [Actinomycetospora sp. C-140]